MRREFRWTRAGYKKAHQLARFFEGWRELPYNPPPLLQRYWDLWDQYLQLDDPLTTPVRQRLEYRLSDADIPF